MWTSAGPIQGCKNSPTVCKPLCCCMSSVCYDFRFFLMKFESILSYPSKKWQPRICSQRICVNIVLVCFGLRFHFSFKSKNNQSAKLYLMSSVRLDHYLDSWFPRTQKQSVGRPWFPWVFDFLTYFPMPLGFRVIPACIFLTTFVDFFIQGSSDRTLVGVCRRELWGFSGKSLKTLGGAPANLGFRAGLWTSIYIKLHRSANVCEWSFDSWYNDVVSNVPLTRSVIGRRLRDPGSMPRARSRRKDFLSVHVFEQNASASIDQFHWRAHLVYEHSRFLKKSKIA